MSKSAIETNFQMQLEANGIKESEYKREYTFHSKRKWRFDFAFIEEKVAVEVHGGTWSGGRHTRGSGFEKDCEKHAFACIDGWFVIPVTTSQVKSGVAVEWLVKTLERARSR